MMHKMNYYYFDALYFDARHQYEDRQGIRVEAETLEEATMRAQKKAHKFERKYPYKVLIEINLEMTLTAAELSRIFKGGDN